MLTYLTTVRAFSRDARLLLAAQALAAISYIGIYVVLFNLYLVRLGYDTAFIGWINGISFLSFALLSLPAGMVGAPRRALGGGSGAMGGRHRVNIDTPG